MYFLFICVGVVIAALFAWQLGEFVRRLRLSREYVRKTRAFQCEGNTGASLLVLGDNTAVGVGADTPQESVPGLMAQALSIDSVENRGVSGAQVRDLMSQIGRARRHGYTYILIMVGGNDIIRFHAASSTAKLLARALRHLPRAEQVILLTAGNVGSAQMFPAPVRAWYGRLNREYHARFEAAARREGIMYVNLSSGSGEDPFAKDPDRYLAPDGLHPSSEGYRLWWQRIAAHA